MVRLIDQELHLKAMAAVLAAAVDRMTAEVPPAALALQVKVMQVVLELTVEVHIPQVVVVVPEPQEQIAQRVLAELVVSA